MWNLNLDQSFGNIIKRWYPLQLQRQQQQLQPQQQKHQLQHPAQNLTSTYIYENYIIISVFISLIFFFKFSINRQLSNRADFIDGKSI